MASATLLHGPSIDNLRRHAVSLAAATVADERQESVHLFEQNTSQRESWIASWREAGRNPLAVNARGIEAFVSTALDRLGEPTPDVATLERQRLIERALVESEALEDGRRYRDDISALFRELEAHGVFTADDLRDTLSQSDLDPTVVDTITSVYDRYESLRSAFAHPDAKPRSERFLAVAEADASLSQIFPEIDHVIVSNYVDPSPVEGALFERIASEFPTTFVVPSLTESSDSGNSPRTTGTDSVLSVTQAALADIDYQVEYIPPSSDRKTRELARRLYTPDALEERVEATDVVTWHEAPTPDREVRHLARRLREQLATGQADPEDILVLAPGMLSYRDRIDDVLTEFDVPHVTSVSILLERTLAGRAILDSLGLCTDATIAQIDRLATNPAVSLDGIDASELTDLSDRLPSNDVGFLREHADDSLRSGLEDLLGDVNTVREANGTRVLGAFGELLDNLALKSNVAGLEGEAPITSGYEERALNRVKEILQSLVPVLERGVEEPLAELEHALEGVRIASPREPSDGRVRLVGLADTPMAPFSHLYVLGATRDHLGTRSDAPRYFKRIKDQLDLPGPDRDRAIDRYRWGTLLGNAETIHVTTPAETMSGEDVLPSPMLEELLTVANVKQTSGIDNERRGSREDVQRALAGRSPTQLEEAITTLQADGICTEPQTAAMRGAATMCANRARPGLSSFDGQLSDEILESLNDDLLREPYSPSRLNTYAKCGFKYYLDKGLDLEVPEDISLDVGRFAVGDVVHDTLEYFYQDLLSASEGPVNLDHYDREELERRFLAAAEQARKEGEDNFASPFDRHKLQTLYAGLATPEENPFYAIDTETEADTGGTGLLKAILDREVGTDRRTLSVERWFGRDDAPVFLENGERLPVHGRADRIDITETDDGGYRATVVDYKTYKRNATSSVQGLDFQLPAYALGARSLVERELGKAPTDLDAEFRVFRLPNKVSHPDSLGTVVAKDLDADGMDFLNDVIPQWVDQLTNGIESGAFQPAFVGAEDAGCRHCDYADVCDVRHHRRFDVIETLDRSDEPGFIPPGSRPGDLAEHIEIPSSGDRL